MSGSLGKRVAPERHTSAAANSALSRHARLRLTAETFSLERGDAWINTGAILARIDFGLAVAAGRVPGAPEFQRR